MEYGNINWILAIASLLAGTGIGAVGYRLLSGGAGQVQQLRQRLAERERELSETRSHLGDHFAAIGAMVSNIQREARALEHRLTEDATDLGGKPRPTRGLDIGSLPTPDAEGDEVPAPRDYADGTRGTLSEDFGLKGEDADAPQPPRY
ncbi:DUF1043 family protein [Halomonas campisalis]|uniref:Z-ring associated protein G n=1 Tax=Billgrantia campisalis TaxID=74661 RepID=A0ABS9P3U3_9GAMM|nr:DUF1043 family protein [Halomonas campisalis]